MSRDACAYSDGEWPGVSYFEGDADERTIRFVHLDHTAELTDGELRLGGVYILDDNRYTELDNFIREQRDNYVYCSGYSLSEDWADEYDELAHYIYMCSWGTADEVVLPNGRLVEIDESEWTDDDDWTLSQYVEDGDIVEVDTLDAP